MTKYREIIRLTGLGFTQRSIVSSCGVSQKTVVKVQRRAKELGLTWPLEESLTEESLRELMFPKQTRIQTERRLPDFAKTRKELLKNGVTKKLLWTEYLEECRLVDEQPLMYSQFCHYLLQNEQKHRATMHISRKPGEQVEVDWAGDPAYITDPDTGVRTKASIFVGVMTYSQYAYVEAFINEKQQAWITAHVHMYDYFGGVAKILVPDNCKTAVDHAGGFSDQRLNGTYRELAEHYNTAIIPARVRTPKDKPNVEASVRHISTWIVAALRNEHFFSLSELNREIREKLVAFNAKPFQKKEGSRYALFHDEELPLLAPLPATPYELAQWKQATVQFNYHISFEGMLYSVPFENIKHKVDVRATDKVVEVFHNQERIASHKRLYGRKGQYATITAHMPKDHQQYLEWNGDRFRNWAKKIGENTHRCVDAILSRHQVEQQAYKSCMGLLKLADRYSEIRLEAACEKALSYTAVPSYKNIKNILATAMDQQQADNRPEEEIQNPHGITRGADYYRR